MVSTRSMNTPVSWAGCTNRSRRSAPTGTYPAPGACRADRPGRAIHDRGHRAGVDLVALRGHPPVPINRASQLYFCPLAALIRTAPVSWRYTGDLGRPVAGSTLNPLSRIRTAVSARPSELLSRGAGGANPVSFAGVQPPWRRPGRPECYCNARSPLGQPARKAHGDAGAAPGH
jgi:hypothetical protein